MRCDETKLFTSLCQDFSLADIGGGGGGGGEYGEEYLFSLIERYPGYQRFFSRAAGIFGVG